jgi:hypothetical protein
MFVRYDKNRNRVIDMQEFAPLYDNEIANKEDDDKPDPTPVPPTPKPDPTPNPDPKPVPKPSPDNVPNPIGNCVISKPTGKVPKDLYTNSGVMKTKSHAPFDKILTVRGITLMGLPDNTEMFMEKVGRFIEEIFPEPMEGMPINAEL